MSALQIIAHIGTVGPNDRTVKIGFPMAETILEALTAAGYRILAPGELDGETAERCATAFEAHDLVGREWVPGSLWDAMNREAASRVRALTGGKDEG